MSSKIEMPLQRRRVVLAPQWCRKEVSADAKCYMKIPQPSKGLVRDILQPSDGDSAIIEQRRCSHVPPRHLTYRRRKLMEQRGDQFEVTLCSYLQGSVDPH